MGFIGIALISVFIIIFVIFCILAFIGLIAGIILNAIFTKKKKEGKRSGKIVTIIARVLIGVCSVALVPLLAIIIVVIVNQAQAPSEFKKTDNIIYSYNESKMETSNGTYVPITLTNSKYWSYYDLDEAVYSYMPSGTFNKWKWKNFFTIKNDTGYEFIAINDSKYQQFSIYCKNDNYSDIIEYYDNNCFWCLEDDENILNFNDSEKELIINYKNHIFPTSNNYINNDIDLNHFVQYTNDNIFIMNDLGFAYNNDDIYYYEENYLSWRSQSYYAIYTVDEELSNVISKFIQQN